jgi:site-specific DNA-methyltransferase (adenine-specific)
MLDREFGFTLDVCASPENAKVQRFFTKDDDGLGQDWGRHVCWMNPPYSQLARWLVKAYESSLRGAAVVCLTFARTDTAGFHYAVARASELRFLRGRLRFGSAKHCAPAPSCIIVFRPTADGVVVPCQVSFGFGPCGTGMVVRTLDAATTT